MTKILIVEDEPLVRGFLRRQLAGRFEVVEAISAIHALDIWRIHNDIEVLICDAELGLVSGMELACLLRAWNGRLRTILTSDLASDQWTERQRVELQELPADDVLILVKPFTPADLTAALTKLMQAEAVAATL